MGVVTDKIFPNFKSSIQGFQMKYHERGRKEAKHLTVNLGVKKLAWVCLTSAFYDISRDPINLMLELGHTYPGSGYFLVNSTSKFALHIQHLLSKFWKMHFCNDLTAEMK